MSSTAARTKLPSVPAHRSAARSAFALDAGEIRGLWWVIQSSGDTDRDERRAGAWDLCARHAAGMLAVEAAYCGGSMHGSAMRYFTLIEWALDILGENRPFAEIRVARGLRQRHRCPICAQETVQPDRLVAPDDVLFPLTVASTFRRLVVETRPWWGKLVCPECAGDGAGPLCRIHIATAEPLEFQSMVSAERAALGSIARRLIGYSRAFRGGGDRRSSLEDEAGAIAAAGWCSGWSDIMAVARTATS